MLDDETPTSANLENDQSHESLWLKGTISYHYRESCSSNMVSEPCPKLSRANNTHYIKFFVFILICFACWMKIIVGTTRSPPMTSSTFISRGLTRNYEITSRTPLISRGCRATIKLCSISVGTTRSPLMMSSVFRGRRLTKNYEITSRTLSISIGRRPTIKPCSISGTH